MLLIIFQYVELQKQIIMLEQLPVLLEYPYTVNCQKCSGILFDIKIIDQFVRQKTDYKNSSKQMKKDNHPANFYLLDASILPSAIFVEKTPFLCQQKPFHMLFLAEIKCLACKSRIGIKILSISSDFSNYGLLSRHLIEVTRVRVRTMKEDVTNQLIQKFTQEWQCSNQFGEIDLSDDLFCNKFQHIKQNKLKQNKQKPISSTKQEQKKSNVDNLIKEKPQNKNQISDKNIPIETKNIKKQLAVEPDEHKQIIKQVIDSIEFFNDVLSSLQKRVAHLENVCNVSKQKIQKIVPLLRKKHEEEKKN